MDLFSASGEKERQKSAPLAARMRPLTLDEIVGQDELIGEGRLLRKIIEGDRLSSVIFYGPPGSGKTTLAKVIARITKADFRPINAVTSGVADIRNVIKNAQKSWNLYNRKTIGFIDEIHRFNKSQQDALLPAVESGLLILIGATTENPYFSVNKPLLSRCKIFRLKSLEKEDIVKLLHKAITDERGLGKHRFNIEEAALFYISDMANGDARIALNTLEFIFDAVYSESESSMNIDLKVARSALQKRNLPYSKEDEHYDVTSCFIKAMRGSDPDATLYWLSRLIYSGEDVAFIARRIVIHAAEDVGLADPQALIIASACCNAVERVGLPESRIILAEAALYVALAPKSNSVVAGIDSASKTVEETKLVPPPHSMRDASYRGAKEMGHGIGYKYPHDFCNHWVKQQYMPNELKNAIFYNPSEQGQEDILYKNLKKRRKED